MVSILPESEELQILSINTNHAAVRANANLAKNNELLVKSMQRYPMEEIIDTSDDAGGLAIAMKLNSSIETKASPVTLKTRFHSLMFRMAVYKVQPAS